MAVNSFNAQNPPVTTKGDVFTFSTIPTRLGVGANNTVLTADSTTATGLKWAAQTGRSASSWSLISSASLTGATTITVSGILNQEMVMVWFAGASSANAASFIRLQINGQTGSDYDLTYHNSIAGSTYSANNNIIPSSGLLTFLPMARLSGSAGSSSFGACFIYGANSTAQKPVQFFGSATADGNNAQEYYHGAGIFTQTGSKITSISLVSSTGNFDNGTVYVWGTSN